MRALFSSSITQVAVALECVHFAFTGAMRTASEYCNGCSLWKSTDCYDLAQRKLAYYTILSTNY
jgi:hypothetical protein